MSCARPRSDAGRGRRCPRAGGSRAARAWLGAGALGLAWALLAPAAGVVAAQPPGPADDAGATPDTADTTDGSAGDAEADAGDRPSASLSYERERGAEQCPDERELRDAVSARLGYVPFREDAGQRVRTVIRAERRGLLATVEVFDAEGVLAGQRAIRSRTRDCEELARGVALAISVAIDPVSLLGPPGGEGEDAQATPSRTTGQPEPEPGLATGAEPVTDADAAETPGAPVPAAEAEPEQGEGPVPPPAQGPDAEGDTQEADAEARAGVRVGIAFDAQLAIEAVPRPRPALALRVDVDGARLGAEVVVRAVLPASESSSLGRVRAYQLDVRALGCALGAGLRGCVGAFAGVVPARGEQVVAARRAVGAIAGLTLGVGYDLPLGTRVTLGLRAGLDVPFVRPRLELAMSEVWRGAPVSVLAALGLGVRLP